MSLSNEIFLVKISIVNHIESSEESQHHFSSSSLLLLNNSSSLQLKTRNRTFMFLNEPLGQLDELING